MPAVRPCANERITLPEGVGPAPDGREGQIDIGSAAHDDGVGIARGLDHVGLFFELHVHRHLKGWLCHEQVDALGRNGVVVAGDEDVEL